MKKLFVSVPMKYRTEEEIRKSIKKMKAIAEAITGEELELIDSYVEDNPPQDSQQAIWYLSKSIEKLATADVFICITDHYDWDGCTIESEIAMRYGIDRIRVEGRYVMDDYDDAMKKLWDDKKTIVPTSVCNNERF